MPGLWVFAGGHEEHCCQISGDIVQIRGRNQQVFRYTGFTRYKEGRRHDLFTLSSKITVGASRDQNQRNCICIWTLPQNDWKRRFWDIQSFSIFVLPSNAQNSTFLGSIQKIQIYAQTNKKRMYELWRPAWVQSRQLQGFIWRFALIWNQRIRSQENPRHASRIRPSKQTRYHSQKDRIDKVRIRPRWYLYKELCEEAPGYLDEVSLFISYLIIYNFICSRSMSSLQAKITYFQRNLNRQLKKERSFPLILIYDYNKVIRPRGDLLQEKVGNFSFERAFCHPDDSFCKHWKIDPAELQQAIKSRRAKKDDKELDILWKYVHTIDIPKTKWNYFYLKN